MLKFLCISQNLKAKDFCQYFYPLLLKIFLKQYSFFSFKMSPFSNPKQFKAGSIKLYLQNHRIWNNYIKVLGSKP
jgi:hypothetical protein